MTIVRRHLGVSSLVTRRALVRRRLRGVVLWSLVGKDCDPSLLLVSGGRSLVVTRRTLVRRLLRVAILRSIVSENCVPSFCAVAG